MRMHFVLCLVPIVHGIYGQWHCLCSRAASATYLILSPITNWVDIQCLAVTDTTLILYFLPYIDFAQRSDRLIHQHLCKAKVDFLMPLLQLEHQLAAQLADESIPVKEHAKWLEDRLEELGIPNDESVCFMRRFCLHF